MPGQRFKVQKIVLESRAGAERDLPEQMEKVTLEVDPARPANSPWWLVPASLELSVVPGQLDLSAGDVVELSITRVENDGEETE